MYHDLAWGLLQASPPIFGWPLRGYESFGYVLSSWFYCVLHVTHCMTTAREQNSMYVHYDFILLNVHTRRSSNVCSLESEAGATSTPWGYCLSVCILPESSYQHFVMFFKRPLEFQYHKMYINTLFTTITSIGSTST